MNALSLKDLSSTESKSSAEQRLTLLENVFSFPHADSSSFPQNHCQEFQEQLQHLPSGNADFIVLNIITLKLEFIDTGEIFDVRLVIFTQIISYLLLPVWLCSLYS